LSKKSVEVDELRIVHTTVREEATQARETKAKVVKIRPRLGRRRPRPMRTSRRY
jgi:hypothetical protein